MPADHPHYKRPDAAFKADAIACVQAINPDLGSHHLLASHCSRYRHAQPVCGPHFQRSLPPLNPLPNLWTAVTTISYPEDRDISESIQFGRSLAARIAEQLSI